MTMKAKLRWSGFVAIGAALLAGPAFAHDDETHSVGGTPGTVSGLVSDLYGGNGITLDPVVVFHAAHFAASSQEQLNNLSNIIASNIGTIAFNSTVSAISFDVEEGVAVRSQESLGPLIAERASTIGRGRINMGVSYTHIDYKQLNGQNLNNLSIVLSHDQEFGVPYEKDQILLRIDLNLKQDIVAFTSTYGLTDSLDVGFVLPLVSVQGRARSVASVIDNGGGGIHQFGGMVSPVSTTAASATGIGDMILRAKWHATKGKSLPVDIGFIGQAAFATGDEKNLLGTGSTSLYGAAIVSANLGKINPHLNIGYEYFINQKRLTGVEIDRSNVKAVAGFDIKARDNFAVATEFLGRWRADGTKLYDVAVGTKWAPVGDVPISANIVIPINRDVGLRPNFYFTLGIEGTF